MFRSRTEIKEEAKLFLRNNYWPMVGTGFLLALISGAFGGNNTSADTHGSSGIWIHIGPFHYHYSGVSFVFSVAALLIALIAIAGAILIAVYLKNPLEYGCKSWFRHIPDGTESGRVLEPFSSPDYHRIVETMFKRDLTILLYSLLFIVPGIIKAYEYYFVPQLLEDHPEMTADEILRLSSDMTMGRKMDLFTFDLSFILWYILSGLTHGLAGIFFGYPYKSMSQQLLYLDMIDNGCDPFRIFEEDEFFSGQL